MVAEIATSPIITLCEAPVATTHQASSSISATATITNASNTITASTTSDADVLLKTATVLLRGPNGTRKILCFFDDGSQKSFIRKELADELNLEITGQENLMISHFGSTTPGKAEVLHKRKVLLRGSFPQAQSIELEVLDKNQICSAQPYIHTEFARRLHAEGKFLGDDRFLKEQNFQEIDLLIGADLLLNIIGRASRSSECGLRAIDSKFGWLLIGQSKGSQAKKGLATQSNAIITMMVRTESCPRQAPFSHVTSLASKVTFADEIKNCEEEKSLSAPEPDKRKEELGFDLQAFWAIDRCGISDDPTRYDHQDFVEEYEKSITRPQEGRYCAPFPWKENKWLMENDFKLAEGRLRNLLVRLRRTPVLLKAYDEEMKQLVEKDFVEEVEVGYDGIHKYVSHHPVIRKDKSTTKIRPVFDGSAKGRLGPSINECLQVGPNLNPDLMAVLMRFRIKRIAWIADIEKAFLNIALPEEDSQAVRFLWSSNPSDPFARNKEFRWKRGPFGLTSSPFQLRATISKHLKSFETKFPSLIREIEAELYVDDLLAGAHTLSEAESAILNTKDIFEDAKLKMTKWTTSDPDLQKILEKEGLSFPLEGLLAKNLSNENPKVLGVNWDTKTDCFLFNPTDIIQAAREIGDEPTKRNLLQISSKIFDPMGFLAPTVLSLKMIFQKMWEDEVGWDKPAPP